MSTAQPENAGAATPGPRILLYSDDVDAREQVRLAVGRRLRRGAPDIEWVEVATAAAVIAQAESGGLDLLILDGEADKVGGLGLARQLKDEIFRCPPTLVLTGRPQDAWLASWSNADAVVSRPLDPVELHGAVAATRRVVGRHPMTDAPTTTTSPTWPDLFATLAARQDLSTDQTSWAMSEIMSGAASTPKIAAFLLGAEDQGRVRRRAHRRWPTRCSRTPSASRSPAGPLDIVGTGGDRSHTVNISTMSALVIAGAGHHGRQARQPRRVVVVRLGRRARGARHPARPPAGPRRGARHRGRHHLLLRAGVPPVVPAHRRSAHASWASGRPSTSSVRSPTPPSRGPPRSASPRRGWHRSWPGCSPDAATSALVFRGEDGLDEIAPTGPTRIWEVRDGGVTGVGRSTGRPTSGSRGSRSSRCAGRRPTTTPTSRDGCSTAEHGSRARDRRAQRRSGARRGRHPAGHRGRHARRTPGRRQRARASGAGQRCGGGRAGAVAGGQRG